MESILSELRLAARSLRRAPAITLAALVTLAMGIGANTAVFSVVDGLLLRPLPYPDPSRLGLIWIHSSRLQGRGCEGFWSSRKSRCH